MYNMVKTVFFIEHSETALREPPMVHSSSVAAETSEQRKIDFMS